jgi:hypothetical protein
MAKKKPQPDSDTCPTCEKTKPIAEFGRDRRRAEHCVAECIACQEICRQGREAARAKRLHDKRQDHRRQALAHYGTACACCGSDRELEIDHVNGDGARHRQEVDATRLYRWLVESGFPVGFQTLCGLCNRSKGDTPRCRLHHATAFADPAADWWLMADVAAYLGIKTVSAKSLRDRSRLPPGDRMIGRTPAWRPATITAWKRPGRGARTDLDQG